MSEKPVFRYCPVLEHPMMPSYCAGNPHAYCVECPKDEPTPALEITDGDSWDGYFRDEIQCPHCSVVDYEHTDYPSSLQRDGDKTEVECYSCGKPFVIELCVDYSYATRKL